MFTMQTAILVYGLSVAIALGSYMFVNCLRPENCFWYILYTKLKLCFSSFDKKVLEVVIWEVSVQNNV